MEKQISTPATSAREADEAAVQHHGQRHHQRDLRPAAQQTDRRDPWTCSTSNTIRSAPL
jgi:hypothetical protein